MNEIISDACMCQQQTIAAVRFFLTGEFVKHVQIRLEKEELDRLDKAVESGRAESKQEAVTQALTQWLDCAAPARFGDLNRRFGEISREEENVVCAVLSYLRDASVSATDPMSMKKSLLDFGRAWAKQNRR